MNKFKKFLILAAFATFSESAATAQDLTPETSGTGANTPREFSPGRGLRFDTDGMSLSTLLDYMSEAAGYVIQLKPGVEVTGKVNIRSAQPLDNDEALAVLKQVLSEYGYSAIVNGRLLTIIRSSDAPRGYAPVRLGNKPDDVPRTAEIVTQVIPIRHLNPVELVKVLRPLLPENVVPTVDESANAIIITDTQTNIRRALEVIAALDSISAGANTLRVFPLHYADAKSLAALVKELFAAPDTATGSGRAARGNAPTFRFPGRGGPGGTADGGDSGQTPITRVAAVADEQGNALIVSAPDSLIPAVEQLVESVDLPTEDVAEVRLFTLVHADTQEMADSISRIFSNDDTSTAAGRGAVVMQGQGGRGVTPGAARQGTTTGEVTGASGRMKKLGRVLAVPDPRTSSLLVSAAKSLMPEIDEVITRLDAIEGNRQGMHVFNLRYADGYELQEILSETFPSATINVSSSTTDPFKMRRDAMFNTFFTSGPSAGRSSFSTATTGGRGSN